MPRKVPCCDELRHDRLLSQRRIHSCKEAGDEGVAQIVWHDHRAHCLTGRVVPHTFGAQKEAPLCHHLLAGLESLQDGVDIALQWP